MRMKKKKKNVTNENKIEKKPPIVNKSSWTKNCTASRVLVKEFQHFFL